MNIRQAKNEIKHTVEAYLKKDEAGDYEIPEIRQRPVLLMGPPGIGKTQIMEQIARELGVGLVAYTITHHTRQSAVGLPFIREEEFAGKTYSVTEYTMSEIIASVYRRIRDSGQREGILFIDEINCVSETLAPTMLQFLQCKTFGNQKIPEGWVIVAAGNPPEYNKSVRDFDMVTLDRVRYMTVEADYRVWKEYARAQHISGAILSYLELRPGNFYRVEADVDGMQFVTARGWEDLSNLMAVYEKLGFLVDEQVIREYIHHADVAEDVAAYLDLYRKYQDDYGIPQILDGCVRPEIYARIYAAAFDERLSVVHLLLDVVSKGGNLALNVAPQPDGLLPAPAMSSLRDMGKWLDVHGEGIYETEITAPYYENRVKYTAKKDTVYAFYLYEETASLPSKLCLHLPEPKKQIASVTLMRTGEPVDYTTEFGALILHLPPESATGGEYADCFVIRF